MISISILEPKHVNNPRDAFVVTCVAMFGDGDEFENIKLAPIYRTQGHESQLEEVIELLEAMENFQWTSDNSYSELDNFGKWFPAEDSTNNGWSGRNPFLDEGYIATLFSYSITYCDNEGIEYAVVIEE